MFITIAKFSSKASASPTGHRWFLFTAGLVLSGLLIACGGAEGQPAQGPSVEAGDRLHPSFDRAAVLVANPDQHLIQLVAQGAGPASLVAGQAGSPGSEDGLGPEARFRGPAEAAVSRDGRFALVADTGNHTIRRIDLPTGRVTTLAGLAGLPGAADGLGPEARFYHPYGLALSRDGAFALVADTGNHTIRRLDLETGRVSTVAGQAGLSGDSDGAGPEARFYCPHGLALNPGDAFALVADYCNHAIRRLDLASYRVSRLTEPGQTNGELDRLAAAQGPIDVDISPDGRFALVVDHDRRTVRHLALLPPQVTAIFGSGHETFDLGRQLAARVSDPRQLTFSVDGAFAVILDGPNFRGLELVTGAVTEVPPQRLALGTPGRN